MENVSFFQELRNSLLKSCCFSEFWVKQSSTNISNRFSQKWADVISLIVRILPNFWQNSSTITWTYSHWWKAPNGKNVWLHRFVNWFCVRRTGEGQYKKKNRRLWPSWFTSRPVMCMWPKSNAPDRIAGCRFWRFLIFPPPSYHTTIIHSSTLWWGELGKVFAENSGLDSEGFVHGGERSKERWTVSSRFCRCPFNVCVCIAVSIDFDRLSWFSGFRIRFRFSEPDQ